MMNKQELEAWKEEERVKLFNDCRGRQFCPKDIRQLPIASLN